MICVLVDILLWKIYCVTIRYAYWTKSFIKFTIINALGGGISIILYLKLGIRHPFYFKKSNQQ